MQGFHEKYKKKGLKISEAVNGRRKDHTKVKGQKDKQPSSIYHTEN